MKKHTSRIIGVFIVTIMVITSLSILMSMMLLQRYENKVKSIPVSNLARIKVNPVINTVKQNYYKAENYEEFYSTIKPELEKIHSEMKMIDGLGNVIFDSEKKTAATLQDKVDIEQMVHYDSEFKTNNPDSLKFTFPITINNTQAGNAVFILPSKDLFTEASSDFWLPYYPLFMGLLLSATLLLLLYLTLRKNIFKPIGKLNSVVPEIMRGNLDFRLESYEYSEIGGFTKAFDMMRTELKESQDRKDKLEKERKELVASISHDIKTPLSSIKAYAEGLRDGIANNPEAAHKYLDVIISKTDGLVKLVNDLLQHSVQDLGNFKMNMEEKYANQVFHEIIEPLRLKMAGSSIQLDLEGKIPDVLIKVDKARIEQVVVNLVQNAEKYALSEGKIVIKAEQEDDCLLVSISDNGRGIPPEDLPFIFDRFYRGDVSRKSNIEGVGLGLSICKYIIEQHGGIIFAESKPGMGSIFRFTIPKI